MEEGATIAQRSFHESDWEKWYIDHIVNSDGYCRIRSAYSNLYLGVDTSKVAPIIQTSVEDDYSLWEFDRANSGNLMLTCKATGIVLALPSVNSPLNGTALTQTTYSDDSSYLDEWNIYRLLYVATINNFYDMGYPVRYNESEVQSQNLINSYNRAVAERYMQLLNLEIICAAPVYYNSPIDICKSIVSTENIDLLCTSCSHTNRNNVINSFKSYISGNAVTTNVYWSGHKITSVATNGTVNYNRSCSSGTHIYIIKLLSDEERTVCSQGVLMHELNHQYGARDHYHELADKSDPTSCKFKDICSECGVNPRSESCIMYSSRLNIEAEDIICNDCKNEILAHLSDHH